jgi:hypothetical protein
MKKYVIKSKYLNCRVCAALGVFILDEKLSQAKLKLLFENGHNDKIDYLGGTSANSND